MPLYPLSPYLLDPDFNFVGAYAEKNRFFRLLGVTSPITESLEYVGLLTDIFELPTKEISIKLIKANGQAFSTPIFKDLEELNSYLIPVNFDYHNMGFPCYNMFLERVKKDYLNRESR